MFDAIRQEIKALSDSFCIPDDLDNVGQLQMTYQDRVLGQLRVIVDNATDDKSFAAQMAVYLNVVWQIIKRTHLDYFRAYDLLINQLLVKLAVNISAYECEQAVETGRSPKSAIELLMPDICMESSQPNYYPQLYTYFDDKEQTWQQEDTHHVLKTHVISHSGNYLIPIEVLARQRIEDIKEALPNIYFDFENHEGDIDAAKLTEDDIIRLNSFSSETQEYVDASKRYLAALKREDSLYAQLTLLIDALRRYSSYGTGHEERASTAIDKAVQAFFDYYEKLDEEALKKIPQQLKQELKIIYDYNYGHRKHDVGSCAATRRHKTTLAMTGHEELLSSIRLDEGQCGAMLSESLAQFKRTQQALLTAVNDATFNRNHSDELSFSLFSFYEIGIRIQSFDELLKLIRRFRAEDLEVIFKSLDGNSEMMNWLIVPDNVFMLFGYVATAKTKLIIDYCQRNQCLAQKIFKPSSSRDSLYLASIFNIVELDKATLLVQTLKATAPEFSYKRIVEAALVNGYKKTMSTLFTLGKRLNIDHGETSHFACCAARGGFLDITASLLQRAESLDERQVWLNSALVSAVRGRQVQMVNWLVEQGADPCHKDEFDNEPLCYACCVGHIGLMQYFIDSGNDINLLNTKRNPLLQFVATSNSPQAIMFVISKSNHERANVNFQDIDGDTPLHDAVLTGAIRSVEKLLELGADLSIKNNRQETPLIIALNHKSKNIALFLVLKSFEQAKFSMTDATVNGETPLLLAAKAGLKKVVDVILEKGFAACRSLDDFQVFKQMIAHKTVDGKLAVELCEDEEIIQKISATLDKVEQKITQLTPMQRDDATTTARGHRSRGFFSKAQRPAGDKHVSSRHACILQ